MDLVDYSEEVYNNIVQDFRDFASRLDNIVEITDIPISALNGDNVVDKSTNMPWYQGPTLLYHLEHVYVGGEENHVDARFPVQWVIRPMSDEWHDFRGYAGRVAGGVFKPGDEVTVLPSGFQSVIKAIHTADGEPRGSLRPAIGHPHPDRRDRHLARRHHRQGQQPAAGQPGHRGHDLLVLPKPMPHRAKLIVRHTTQETKAIIQEVRITWTSTPSTRSRASTASRCDMNDIGRISLRTAVAAHPRLLPPQPHHRLSFILIDPGDQRNRRRRHDRTDHAAGLWGRYYLELGVTELSELLPFRSKDLDLIGTMELLENLQRRFKGKILRSEPRSPVFGRLDIPQPGGGFLRVEVLHTVLGLDQNDLKRTMNLEVAGIIGRIPLPHLVLKAKLANSVLIKQEGRQDVKHVRMMLLCTRAFIREFLEKCRLKLIPERAVVNLLEEIREVVGSSDAAKATKLWDFDYSGVWPFEELRQFEGNKISRWLHHRFPSNQV
jgi:hypothetical protein